MKYVYYELGTGSIKMISPVKEESSEYPYIEVEEDAIEDIFSGKKKAIDHFVKPSSKTSNTGLIIAKKKDIVTWKSINDWLYMIPNENEFYEMHVLQDIANKQITINLTDNAKIWWKGNNFFQKKYFLFSACIEGDPHFMTWYKMIPSEELLNTVSFEYSGNDNIRFYTHRYFESYIHEQHT